MCTFVSWIEKDNKVYFLTGKMVYHSPKGKALQEWSGNIIDDRCGHGAIRFYFDLGEGENKECDNFSSQANFPNQIAKAIKDGDMEGMHYEWGLLNNDGQYKFSSILKPAWKKCVDTRQNAQTEYYNQKEMGEYNKIVRKAWAEYENIVQPAFWGIFANPENRNPAWV